jgi:hypothetical protein
MKKLTIGLVMLFAVPAILVSGIWGKTIGDFAVAHFTDHRPALTACSDWGSVVVTRTHEPMVPLPGGGGGHDGYTSSETFLYCSPLFTKAEAEDSSSYEVTQSKITNDGRYINDSVRIYSLDVGNFVRASIMLLLTIGGAVLVFGATKSRYRKKVNEIQMSNNKTGDI